METTEILMFYVTFPDEEKAAEVGEKMVKNGLAACANLIPVKSCFVWQENFEKEGEVVAIFKTLPDLETSFRKRMEDIHPYDVPCIISWSVQSNMSYRNWVESNTKP